MKVAQVPAERRARQDQLFNKRARTHAHTLPGLSVTDRRMVLTAGQILTSDHVTCDATPLSFLILLWFILCRVYVGDDK